MTGDADTMGAGARVLVKGLVGGTFGSAAKITGEVMRPVSCAFLHSWVTRFSPSCDSISYCETLRLSRYAKSIKVIKDG